ncbi:B-cell CLL/lymphoma 6 member B protein isoform X3 [Sphaerodactylus townsendi]|uniref:B-cell CLL/lymphoma 6 member B protein isoform X3 n=1 Tax=Sphaerodactylus townsendi TaxID=933632 RepID=UPI00202644DE|nr:B-cell CLL/lymphoma 6 member B protein isoform X3 [Sphaerodactylus townsendi]
MAGPGDPSYVREFTRHSGDVLLNLNELRKRHVLTDVTLRVGGRPLQAHKAVLTACSGFFYSIFLGHGGHEVSVLTLPSSIEPAGFRALLDFMYTSRLLLTPGTVPAVLAAASYLQMEHVVESCHRFIQARMLPSQAHGCPVCLQPPPWICSHSGGDVSGGQGSPSSGTGYQEEEEGGGSAPPQPHSEEKPYKCHFCNSAFRYKGNLASHRSLHTGEKPYRCRICGAQFNRPANLKTHLRIHSGEKPFKCETCGSRFVQVAHLRAHVLIHTGEKPYPCDTCGTRFRHLQTLKSHVRIHTGEKPYQQITAHGGFQRHASSQRVCCCIFGACLTPVCSWQCEKCNLRFRHKSQLRLHLRQKHGAVTNTKICYKVLDGPHATLC